MVGKDDGGFAFPRPHSTDECEQNCSHYYDQQGMTLRDWFAGQIAAAMVGKYGGESFRDNRANMARDAYLMADAMLVERKRGEQG